MHINIPIFMDKEGETHVKEFSCVTDLIRDRAGIQAWRGLAVKPVCSFLF